MLAAFLIAAHSRLAPTLPSFDEIQKGMYEAYRALSHYSDEWEIVLQKGKDAPVHQTFARKIDKERSEFTAKVEGDPIFRQTHDGSNFGLALIKPRVFGKSAGPNEDFTATFEKSVRPKLDDNSFNYYVKAYDILFVSNPAFVVSSDDSIDLEGKKARRIVATAKRADGSATLKLTYWFEPTRWILRKVELDGKSVTAGTFTIRGNLLHIDFDAKIPAGDFLLKPEDLAGYHEVPVSALQGG